MVITAQEPFVPLLCCNFPILHVFARELVFAALLRIKDLGKKSI